MTDDRTGLPGHNAESPADRRLAVSCVVRSIEVGMMAQTSKSIVEMLGVIQGWRFGELYAKPSP
jgi:hypothetical protein